MIFPQSPLIVGRRDRAPLTRADHWQTIYTVRCPICGAEFETTEGNTLWETATRMAMCADCRNSDGRRECYRTARATPGVGFEVPFLHVTERVPLTTLHESAPIE